MKSSGHPPFSIQTVNKVLVVIIVFLAFLAGYYHSKLNVEKNRYNYLNRQYMRIENDLIDLEAEVEATQSGTTTLKN